MYAALEITFAPTTTAAETTTVRNVTEMERQREVLRRSLSTRSRNIRTINTQMLSLSLSTAASSSGSSNDSGIGRGVNSTRGIGNSVARAHV